MPRIILKCRYLKHEKAHLAHLVRYIATREGVEMARDTHDHLPATARQKQLIDELLQALPHARLFDEDGKRKDFDRFRKDTAGILHSFFSSPEDLDMAITGIYNKYYQTNARVFRAIYVWCADDVTAHSGGNKSRFSEYDRFNFNSGNTDILEMYQLYYQTIKACNYVINNAERTPVEKSFLEPRLGQAYFLRALNYFMLVRIWGRIPLVTENEIDYNTPKADVQKIYELIESDALTAERMLPDNHKIAPYFQNGINVAPNKGAAKALLASVYMTEAGWPLKKGAEYYDKAAAKYKEIIENEATYGYILEPDIRTLTKEPEANYSKEIVFGEFHNKTKNYFSGPKSELPEESGGWCDYMVELEFFRNMPEGIRKDAWFLTKVTMTGQERNPETGRYPLLDWDDPATNQKHPYWKKNIESSDWVFNYDDRYYETKGISSASGKTRMIFRYADILLLYAEAVAYGSKNIDDLAFDCMWRVQKRAGVPLISKDVTKEYFQKAVLDERRWETAGMEHSCMGRFFTMQRHEILHLQKNYRDAAELSLNPNLTLSEEFYYFPIPDNELLIVPGLKD